VASKARRKLLKKKKVSKERKPTKSQAKKRAWTAFSQYIRQRYADEKGITRCVTCNMSAYWKNLQAGHFIPGRTNSILFEELCVFPQCYVCNIRKHGNLLNYYPFMLKHFGQQIIDKLKRQSKNTKQLSTNNYLDIEKKYLAFEHKPEDRLKIYEELKERAKKESIIG
jgi:hypothetical protein